MEKIVNKEKSTEVNYYPKLEQGIKGNYERIKRMTNNLCILESVNNIYELAIELGKRQGKDELRELDKSNQKTYQVMYKEQVVFNQELKDRNAKDIRRRIQANLKLKDKMLAARNQNKISTEANRKLREEIKELKATVRDQKETIKMLKR